MFVYMHLRCIQYIIGCQQQHPSLLIWMSKIEYKSAYRHKHFNANTAVKSLTQVIIDNYIFHLIALHLTFGGKPLPIEWGCIAEPVTELANYILTCTEWDPSTTHSPSQNKFSSPTPRPRTHTIRLYKGDNGKNPG